jgi:flavodoxin
MNLLKKTRKALIVYASHSGNAELVANAICDGLCEKDVISECIRAELTKIDQLQGLDLIVLVSSTYNVGQLNDNFVRLDSELNKTKEMFAGKRFAVVGLGDSEHYDIFCGAADILEATVKNIGGNQVIETLRLDGPPHNILRDLKKWGEDLAVIINP